MAGSAPTNSQAVDFEKQQAAEAQQKEADRQARLQQGQTLIDQIFNGTPVMATRTVHSGAATPGATSSQTSGTGVWPNVNTSSTDLKLPLSTPAEKRAAAGFGSGFGANANQAAGTAWNARTGLTTTNPSTGASAAYSGSNPVTPGADSFWGTGGGTASASGGDTTETYDTGQRTGGFDDAFYNKYNQKVLDYYNPQESRQYDTAQRDLKYSLARAGTLQSSTAADKQGELAYSDALNKADIVANANKQTGALRDQIQANKESLINQLYATEDPTLTANLAQSSVNATKLQDPTLTPVANLFTPIAVGAASYLNSATSPNLLYGAQGVKTSPTPAAASSSSGKVTYS